MRSRQYGQLSRLFSKRQDHRQESFGGGFFYLRHCEPLFVGGEAIPYTEMEIASLGWVSYGLRPTQPSAWLAMTNDVTLGIKGDLYA